MTLYLPRYTYTDRLVGRPLGSDGRLAFQPVDVADWLGVAPSTAREWLREWTDEGCVTPASGTDRIRSYGLRRDFDTWVLGAGRAVPNPR